MTTIQWAPPYLSKEWCFSTCTIIVFREKKIYIVTRLSIDRIITYMCISLNKLVMMAQRNDLSD